MKSLRRSLIAGCAVLGLSAGVAGSAMANPTGTTGQPSQSCQNPLTPVTPGNAGSSSNLGSVFSPNGQSGTVYAGNVVRSPHQGSNAISQYDVACFQVSQPHP
jgi:hypothetical protein